MDRLIKEFISTDRIRRVWIVQRDDGIYSYRCLWYGDPRIAGKAGPYCGLYDSADTAETEARSNVPWLNECSN